MRLENLTKPQRLAGASMLVVGIAAFLPWVSIFGFGITGIKGDGRITLVCAVVGLVLLVIGRNSRAARALAYTAAILTALVGFGDMNGSAAIGLYLTLFGGVAWVAALVWDGSERKKGVAGADASGTPA
jgi:hypothetical protein